jgi:hypothetical protein
MKIYYAGRPLSIEIQFPVQFARVFVFIHVLLVEHLKLSLY